MQTKAERRESNAIQSCHWTISFLKRWLLGTHAGAAHPKHLHAYLDEYAFRHNRRKTNGVGRIAARVIERRRGEGVKGNATAAGANGTRDLSKLMCEIAPKGSSFGSILLRAATVGFAPLCGRTNVSGSECLADLIIDDVCNQLKSDGYAGCWVAAY